MTGSMTPAPTELTLAPKVHMDGRRDRWDSALAATGTILGHTGKLSALWPGTDLVSVSRASSGERASAGGWPGSGEQESLRASPGGSALPVHVL